MKRRLYAVLLIAGSLVLGLLIYYTQRTDQLYINDWMTKAGGAPFKEFLQSSLAGIRIPARLIYSLPDGMWMLALTVSILMIWNFRINRSSLAWIAIVLAAGTGFECMQGLHWIKGWYDPIDMIFILAGTAIPVTYLMIKNRLCKPN